MKQFDKIILVSLLFCCFFDLYGHIFNSSVPEFLYNKKVINKNEYNTLCGWYQQFEKSLQKEPTEKLSEELPIVIIIPSYNNKDWYELNLLSVFGQKYSNYKIIYINDCSTDGTGKLVEEFIKKVGKEDLVQMINNDKRRGALYNLYHAIHLCPDNAIIATLDGDDWLFDNEVLIRINRAYANNNILLTYGQMYEYPSGRRWYCQQLPTRVIQEASYRSHIWCTSHLRTFYAWLFKKINKKDLQNLRFRFWPMSWDQAFMFPMLEMAAGRIQFISEILYVYNMVTPMNDNKVNAKLQKFCEKNIRSLPKYAPITEDEVIDFFKKKVRNEKQINTAFTN